VARPNTNPVFPGQYGRAVVSIGAAADTAFDGSDTDFVEVVECPASEPGGYLIRKITVQAKVSTTAGQVKLGLSPDGSTTRYPWRNILVSAITVGAAVLPFWAQLDDQNDEELAGGLILPPGWSLVASTHIAEAMAVHCEYGIL